LGILAGGAGLTATATATRALAIPCPGNESGGKGAPATWVLDAVETANSFGDGAMIPFFEYQAVGGGQTRGSLPYAEATEGVNMTVTVTNSLAISVRPAVLGVARGPWIRPGQTDSFTFTMPAAGTWLLSTAQNPEGSGTGSRQATAADRPTIGLGGTLVSRPASGNQVLYDGGPSFDREYVLLFDDADDRWNAVQNDPRASLPGPYEANYFRVNGLTFPGTFGDTDTLISAMLGERVLIRMGNLGRVRQSVHMHGHHSDVVARNNVPEMFLGKKDTMPVPSGTTTDIITTMNQQGMFPFHPHDITAVTANGFYPFGQLTLVIIS
jgi:FtsP/CotA-like multicopper oxidase with cupredoxin domain